MNYYIAVVENEYGIMCFERLGNSENEVMDNLYLAFLNENECDPDLVFEVKAMLNGSKIHIERRRRHV